MADPQNDGVGVESEGPSDRQIRVAETLAEIKGLRIPPEVVSDRNAWWKWINENVSRVDADIAHTMRVDFGIDCNLNDPVSIIGALSYSRKVTITEAAMEDERERRARDLLVAGKDSYTVADILHVPDDWVFRIVKQVEAEGHEVYDC